MKAAVLVGSLSALLLAACASTSSSGYELMQQGRFAEAEAKYRIEGRELSYMTPLVTLTSVADAQIRQGKYKEAIATLQEAMSIDDNPYRGGGTASSLVSTLLVTGDIDGANRILDAAVGKVPLRNFPSNWRPGQNPFTWSAESPNPFPLLLDVAYVSVKRLKNDQAALKTLQEQDQVVTAAVGSVRPCAGLEGEAVWNCEAAKEKAAAVALRRAGFPQFASAYDVSAREALVYANKAQTDAKRAQSRASQAVVADEEDDTGAQFMRAVTDGLRQGLRRR